MNLTDNLFFNYIVVFWSGVIVSFTPCVYPVMPLTASFIAAADEKGTKWMGFVLSAIFVLGLSITYCSLAVFAALTGKVFGQFQENAAVYFCVAAVLIFFALVMFDVVSFLHFGIDVQKHIKPKNAWAVFLSGMASGLIIGPCTGPVLGTLLLFVASKQNVFYGISLLFVFSYGIGASLILIGTFSGLLSSMPRSGVWLIRIKQFCGAVLLVAGVFFICKAVRLLIP